MFSFLLPAATCYLRGLVLREKKKASGISSNGNKSLSEKKEKKNKKKEIQLHLKISNKPSLLGFDGGSLLSLRVELKRACGIIANYSTSLPEKRNFMKFLPSGM